MEKILISITCKYPYFKLISNYTKYELWFTKMGHPSVFPPKFSKFPKIHVQNHFIKKLIKFILPCHLENGSETLILNCL
jgi:hypothetical protein